MRRIAGLTMLALTGCSGVSLPQIGPTGEPAGIGALMENRVWIDEGAGAPPGSLRAWMSSGELVMASCTETPRVVPWRWTGDATLEWREDVAVPAEVALVGPDELVLVLDLVWGPETRRYRAAGLELAC